MSISSIQLARVSNLLRSSVTNSNITSSQKQLLQVQQELSTGRRLIAPSDDAGDAAVAQTLRKTLEKNSAYTDNLDQAQMHMGQVDSTLNDLTDLVRQAQSIASANVGSDVPPDSRLGAAEVIKSLYNQMLSLANQQFQGTYLFGGAQQDRPPFVEEAGGVKFQGSKNTLSNEVDQNAVARFMIDGDEVFGALSTRVEGSRDLSPAINLDTRLSELKGASGRGVARGEITLSNGSVAGTVDLTKADTIGDVVAAINAAAVGGITAAISPNGLGITLSGGPAETISVNEMGGATVAADLGIVQPTPLGAGVALNGQSVGAKVTLLTKLADLAPSSIPPIDLTSGLIITNGLTSATIDLTGAVTVEDFINRINGSGTAVKAEINAAGNGINLLNPTAGMQLRIGENGGTTATDLGIRSFDPTSQLSQLNQGRGVRLADGADLRITRSDGSSFDVDLSSAITMADAIEAINLASGGTASAGVGVTASFATTGNGLVLTDSAGGADQLSVANLNFSQAVQDLGLDQPPAGNVISAADVHPVKAQGLFSNIAQLRDALLSGDQQAITTASEGLDLDYKRVVNLRGRTGARVQELQARSQRLEDQNLATKGMLSLLEDTNYTEAIARFQTLQTALQATMQTSGRMMNMSLLDFLG